MKTDIIDGSRDRQGGAGDAGSVKPRRRRGRLSGPSPFQKTKQQKEKTGET